MVTDKAEYMILILITFCFVSHESEWPLAAPRKSAKSF